MMHSIRVAVNSGHPLLGLLHDAAEDGWLPRWIMWPGLDAITRRSGETYADYIIRVSSHPAARRVKIADLRDNLTRNGGPPGNLRLRYTLALKTLEADT